MIVSALSKDLLYNLHKFPFRAMGIMKYHLGRVWCRLRYLICTKRSAQHLAHKQHRLTKWLMLLLEMLLIFLLFRASQSLGVTLMICISVHGLSIPKKKKKKLIKFTACKNSHCYSVACACQGGYFKWIVWWHVVIPSLLSGTGRHP